MVAVEQLVAHWMDQGLPLAKGLPEASLRRFESQYSVVLPQDLREYFKRINGHVQQGGADADHEGFAFWPLEKVQPVPSVCAADNIPIPPVEHPEHYFVFADYLQWSWAYAIRLGATDNAVIFVGAGAGEIIAPSFTDFLHLYLQDSEALYPRPRAAG